eukprot:5658285-Amphidinium_carterae.2
MRLLSYYNKAVTIVRDAGMRADTVAVVLPVFQRDYQKLTEAWSELTKDKHRNFCFEDTWPEAHGCAVLA